MRKVKQTLVVPYSAQQMYTLVNDIQAYPQFLPMCNNSSFIKQSETEIIATVQLAKGLLSYSFTTKNTLKPYESIKMQLVAGPFSHLDGAWHFTALSENSCQIDFTLEFVVANTFIARALDPMFHAMLNKLVAAFITRAATLYGTKPLPHAHAAQHPTQPSNTGELC
jgi:ribosome-associated toxin RatA of RatAB toxin-antitoxin module